MKKIPGKVVLWILVGLLHVYRYVLSPALHAIAPGCGCRFRPTCSEYCLESLKRHGVLRGGWLGVRRLSRCHPWGGDGWDPVPVSSAIRRVEEEERKRSLRTAEQMNTHHG